MNIDQAIERLRILFREHPDSANVAVVLDGQITFATADEMRSSGPTEDFVRLVESRIQALKYTPNN